MTHIPDHKAAGHTTVLQLEYAHQRCLFQIQILDPPQRFPVADEGPGICIWNREAEMLLRKTPSMDQRSKSFTRQTSCAIHRSPIAAGGSSQVGAFSGARGASLVRKQRGAWKHGDSRSPGHQPLMGHEMCG